MIKYWPRCRGQLFKVSVGEADAEQATRGVFGGNAFDFGVKFSFKSCNFSFFF